MTDAPHRTLTEAERLAIAKDDEISAYIGVPPYDPDRPLPVRYADVIAARNAVGYLLSALHHGGDVEHHRQSVRMGVAAGAIRGGLGEFETFHDAATFLDELRARLSQALPNDMTPTPPRPR